MIYSIIGWFGFWAFSTFVLAVIAIYFESKSKGIEPRNIADSEVKSALGTAALFMLFVTMMLIGIGHFIAAHIH